MFPTSGFFQELLCPALTNGNCDRPYCHFNHFGSQSLSKENVPSNEKSYKPSTDPVYKPTPISILDQSTENSQSQSVVEHPTSVNCSRAIYEEVIPVYQPTPISELEKYAPNSLSDYGFTNGFTAQDPPTYSPVVKIKSLKSPVPFTYQPSPIISESIAPSYNDEVTEINIDSDEDNSVQIITKNDSGDASTQSTANNIQNLRDSKLINHESSLHKKRLKRKIKSAKSKETSVTDEVKSASNGNKKTIDNVIEDRDDGSNDSLSKRQKILSLYQDLYGDTDNNSSSGKSNMSKSSSKSVSLISPYLGPIIKKPDMASTNKKIDNVNIAGNSQVDSVARPRVPLRKSDKIPMPIRTRYLDQFIEECLLIYDHPGDAYKRALEDEQVCHDKATSRMAYLNAVIQCLKSLKAEKTSVQLGEKPKVCSTLVTRPSNISCANSRLSDSYESSSKKDDAEEKLERLVRGPLLYSQLTTYLLSEDDLSTNGYPRELKENDTIVRGKAALYIPENKRQLYGNCQSNERVCCRCGTRFLVDEFGQSLTKGECIYHWGKAVKQRSFGRGLDLRYLCCNGDIGQPGCQICSKGHVHDANKWLDNEGFVVTLPPFPKSSKVYEGDDAQEEACNNVYALDCEMVYTTGGCELARITIVNSKLEAVLDEIVCPDNPIVDCNSRFSGLRLEDVEQASYHITDIQAKLLHLFDSDTILVGHSLESDLTALKLIHSKVVDTSIMFPHRLGLPNKRALRNLVSEILQQIIQQNGKLPVYLTFFTSYQCYGTNLDLIEEFVMFRVKQ
ncbi:unnamed protein product [Heterobilharzia americana]|nr:unnamed protein product [Heterobilharzia americana]